MGLISELLENKRLRTQLENTTLKTELKHHAMIDNIIEGTYRVEDDPTDRAYGDDDEYRWKRIAEAGGGWVDSETTRINTVQSARLYQHSRPLVAGILRTYERFLTHSLTITPEDDSDEVFDFWAAWQKTNLPQTRIKEIVRRLLRDGEVFISWQQDKSEFRFIDPLTVCDPQDKRSKPTLGVVSKNGVIFADANDYKSVVAFWVKSGDKFFEVSIDDLWHFKAPTTDEDEPRGRSYLEPILAMADTHNTWVKDRAKISKVLGMFAWHKMIPSQSVSANRGLPTQSVNVHQGQTKSYKSVEAGSIITTSPGVEIKPLSPQLHAGDANQDGSMIARNVAAGLALPEFIISSDASNANYASTMVAEGPAIKEFLQLQEFLGTIIERIYERVLMSALASGEVPEETRQTDVDDEGNTIERLEPTSVECSVNFGPLSARNVQDDVKLWDFLLINNLAAKETVTSLAGYDYWEEQTKRAKEKAQEPKEQQPQMKATTPREFAVEPTEEGHRHSHFPVLENLLQTEREFSSIMMRVQEALKP